MTNATFTEAVAREIDRLAFFSAPPFALRLAMGELADVVLSSQRVLPDRAIRAGFMFRCPTLDAALADLLHAAPMRRQVQAPS